MCGKPEREAVVSCPTPIVLPPPDKKEEKAVQPEKENRQVGSLDSSLEETHSNKAKPYIEI